MASPAAILPAAADDIANLEKAPVSQWDFGIYKLNDALRIFVHNLSLEGFGPEKNTGQAHPILGASASPTKDGRGLKIIVVLGVNKDGGERTKAEFERDASAVIDRLRMFLEVNEPRDGTSLSSGIAGYFLPPAASLYPSLHDQVLRSDLEARTAIDVVDDVSGGGVFGSGACRAPLSGDSFSCDWVDRYRNKSKGH